MQEMLVSDILGSNWRRNRSPKGVDYELPFHNVCCRARVRVVDYFPPDLVDFAVPCGPKELEGLSDDESDSNQSRDGATSELSLQHTDDAESQRWQWRFYLLVEDAAPGSGRPQSNNPSRMKILVADHDAERLLRMDAEE